MCHSPRLPSSLASARARVRSIAAARSENLRVVRRALVTLAVLSLAVLPASARADDPGRWTITGTTTLPLEYYQGVTPDPSGNLYFDGIDVGLYRTDSALKETARTMDVIPADVHAREKYNHIGDLTWDGGEGGRVLLPLECYYPGTANGGNSCLNGAIGVADPQTLQWRYYVRLDPAEIPKAMWAEVSPEGDLLWTSSGKDLLAYSTANIVQASGDPASAPFIRSVRRLDGGVPPSGITGATFLDGRLFVAGQDAAAFQVWSIDLATGERTLEIERNIVGESEGLATAQVKGGILQWLIQPFTTSGKPPTYGPNHATLVSFRRAVPGDPPASEQGPPPPASVRFVKRSRATVLRRGGFVATLRCPDACSATYVVSAAGSGTLARGTKRLRFGGPVAGRSVVRLTKAGRRLLRRGGPPLSLTLTTTVKDVAGGTVRHTSSMRLR